MIALLDFYSRMQDEPAMLARAETVICNVLSRQAFRDIARPEEIIAVQYVIGRAAFFRSLEDHDGA